MKIAALWKKEVKNEQVMIFTYVMGMI
jgi:hypothetical protein